MRKRFGGITDSNDVSSIPFESKLLNMLPDSYLINIPDDLKTLTISHLPSCLTSYPKSSKPQQALPSITILPSPNSHLMVSYPMVPTPKFKPPNLKSQTPCSNHTARNHPVILEHTSIGQLDIRPDLASVLHPHRKV